MKRHVNLDVALLRTFHAVVESGTLAAAANLVSRSQPAVSQQIDRLEELIGQPLFRKKGRQLTLTEAGDVFLNYANRLLELNDEAVSALSSYGLSGSIKLGIPQDFADGFLTDVLARFARAHSSVLIEVRAERNTVLKEQLNRRQLDLALMFGEEDGKNTLVLGQVPMVWVGAGEPKPMSDPIPLVVFEPPCIFRQAAVDALEREGRRWRVSFSSPSLSSQWAAVEAGLGISMRTVIGLRGKLRILGKRDGFPTLKPIGLSLHMASDKPEPAIEVLQSILVDTLQSALSQKAYVAN